MTTGPGCATATTRARPPGLGVVTGTALTVAAVVGTGVLALPGIAVADAGPAALVAVLALLVLSVPLAATFAALGSRFPGSGGVSGFVARGVGPGAATVTAWWFFLGVPLGVPALGLFAGDYVRAVVGGGQTTRVLTALAVLLVSAASNACGLRLSGGLQLVLTGVLVGSLVLVMILCAPVADAHRLTPFAPHGWSPVAHAALVLVWMLTGWEAVSHLTGRFRDPQRDVPRASAATLAVVAVLFGGVTLTLVTVVGSAATGAAPVTDLLATRLGTAAGPVAAAVALLVTLGNSNAYVAGLAELGGEMGRLGQAPGWLARGRSPDVAGRSLAVVTLQSLASLTLVTAFGWSTEHLVLITAASQVAVYLAGLVAALRLLPRRSTGWWAAGISLPPVLTLAVLSGWCLLAPAALAAAALTYRRLSSI